MPSLPAATIPLHPSLEGAPTLPTQDPGEPLPASVRPLPSASPSQQACIPSPASPGTAVGWPQSTLPAGPKDATRPPRGQAWPADTATWEYCRRLCGGSISKNKSLEFQSRLGFWVVAVTAGKIYSNSEITLVQNNYNRKKSQCFDEGDGTSGYPVRGRAGGGPAIGSPQKAPCTGGGAASRQAGFGPLDSWTRLGHCMRSGCSCGAWYCRKVVPAGAAADRVCGRAAG